MDTLYYLVQGTLPVAIPLLLVALGGMFSEHSGVINIALEGIMLVGAFTGCLFVYSVQETGMNAQLILLLGMMVAAVFGFLYSMLLSLAAVNLRADQTITGTALNMLIPAVVLLFSKMYFNSDGVTTDINFYIRKVPHLGEIPAVGKLFFQNTYLTVPIGIVFLVLSTIFFYKTRLRRHQCDAHAACRRRYFRYTWRNWRLFLRCGSNGRKHQRAYRRGRLRFPGIGGYDFRAMEAHPDFPGIPVLCLSPYPGLFCFPDSVPEGLEHQSDLL